MPTLCDMPTLFHIQLQQAFELTCVDKALYFPQLNSGKDNQVSRALLVPMTNPYRIHFMIYLPAASELFPFQILLPLLLD